MMRPLRATELIASGISARTQLLRAANALAPINLLPTELLVEIFRFLAASPPDDDSDDDEDEDEEDSWQRTKGCVEWLVVTEVCHHWYDVATTSPTFWQVIDVYSNVKWLQLCLERSGAASIDVRFHDMDTAESEDAETLMVNVRHASRISCLCVLPRPEHAWFSLHNLEDVPMPLLKEFNVAGGSALRINKSYHPALEVLRSRHFDIDWKKLPYEHLRILNLESSTPRYEDRIPSLDAFLHMLGSFQKLEELNLNFSIPLDTPFFKDEKAKADYWRSSRILFLPHLRKINFTSRHCIDGPTDVFVVLSHMRLARSTSVTIWMGLVELNDFRGLLGLLPQDSNAFPFLTDATSASIRHGTETLIFTVKSSGGATLSVEYNMVAGGYMKDAYGPDDALADFCTLFSSVRLTQLDISCKTGLEITVRAFRAFSCLRELIVTMRGRRRDFDDFLAALSADDDGVVLPALHILRLRRVPWRENLFEDIASCLEARTTRNGAQLSDLAIWVAPGVDNPGDFDYEDMLDELRPFVAEGANLVCYND